MSEWEVTCRAIHGRAQPSDSLTGFLHNSWDGCWLRFVVVHCVVHCGTAQLKCRGRVTFRGV